MSRTTNSIKNIQYAVAGQVFGLLAKFVSRLVFVRILSAEYLGIDGLFTNILSILSLAELGVGTAIVYSLYKPIAEDDIEKIKSLMDLFKKTYRIIGLVIMVLGLMLTPFLDYLIKEMPDVAYIRFIFVIFVLNSAVSYFYSYKRFLIIANQKKYIATLYRYAVFVLMNVIQIIILVITGNYILFLLVEVLSTFFENLLVSRKADQLYPYLKEKNIDKLAKSEMTTIKKNVQALIFHRIGGVIVLGTDNLLISIFIGIVAVGTYSNYLLVLSSLMMIYSLIFESLTASVGNLGITQSKKKNTAVFEMINFLAFWIYGFSSIALWNLVNPFIELWLGPQFLFDMTIVTVLVVNFYLTGMRKSVKVFRDAHGLYWYDRYKSLVEAVINILVSIVLVNYLGIIGIFLGTMISTITTSFWVEPYVLYRHGLKTSVKPYFSAYGRYTLFTIVAALPTAYFCSFFKEAGFLYFVARAFICLIIPNLIFFIIFRKDINFLSLKGIGKNLIIGKILKKNHLPKE